MEQIDSIRLFIRHYERGHGKMSMSPSTWYCEVKNIVNDRFSLVCSKCRGWLKCYDIFNMRFMK